MECDDFQINVLINQVEYKKKKIMEACTQKPDSTKI